MSLRRHGDQNKKNFNGIIQSLALDGLELENHFNPKNDDIYGWFNGAPEWVRRS